MPNLSTNIINTISFFDLFNYPRTAYELWRFDARQQTLAEFYQKLSETNLEKNNGFYFLPGRQELPVCRHRRYSLSDAKYKRALKATWFFSRLPWIKLVCLANQIGAHNLRAAGDIDFFIVTQARRLWLSRLFLSGALKILKLRPTKQNSQNALCLSFWVDESNLNLADYRLPDDPYFRYWLASLTPLYNNDATYEKLIQANNWLAKELPNWQPFNPIKRRLLKNKKGLFKPNRLLDRVEVWAKNFQLNRLPSELKNLANQDTRVIIKDGVAKLHAEDKREYFLKKYQNNFKNIGS